MQITELIVNVQHILVRHRQAMILSLLVGKKIEKKHLLKKCSGRNMMIFRQIKL